MVDTQLEVKHIRYAKENRDDQEEVKVFVEERRGTRMTKYKILIHAYQTGTFDLQLAYTQQVI